MTNELERFTLRWAVDISVWAPEDPEWQFLLGLLPPEDQQAVQRFKFRDDQKRALASRSALLLNASHDKACCRMNHTGYSLLRA